VDHPFLKNVSTSPLRNLSHLSHLSHPANNGSRVLTSHHQSRGKLLLPAELCKSSKDFAASLQPSGNSSPHAKKTQPREFSLVSAAVTVEPRSRCQYQAPGMPELPVRHSSLKAEIAAHYCSGRMISVSRLRQFEHIR